MLWEIQYQTCIKHGLGLQVSFYIIKDETYTPKMNEWQHIINGWGKAVIEFYCDAYGTWIIKLGFNSGLTAW